ncbi:MAG: hypothetical protein IKL87_08040 [Oscillospiraceae bacterium]|nr:hypothetical protein [Oscillospiraceae bacterium]
MSYIVMECHDTYVILMDDASRFVKAANLRYTVGQVVDDPILMEEREESKPKIRMILGTAAAAAACFAVGFGAYQYYAKNLKTDSVVMILTEAKFRMDINQKGEVISVESDDAYGTEILEHYSGKGKDQLTVANELLEIEISKGYISDGDTFDLYISAKESEDYDTLKSNYENGLSDLNLKVNVLPPDGKPGTKPGMKEPPVKPDGDSEKPEKPTAGTKPQPGENPDPKPPQSDPKEKPSAPKHDDETTAGPKNETGKKPQPPMDTDPEKPTPPIGENPPPADAEPPTAEENPSVTPDEPLGTEKPSDESSEDAEEIVRPPHPQPPAAPKPHPTHPISPELPEPEKTSEESKEIHEDTSVLEDADLTESHTEETE